MAASTLPEAPAIAPGPADTASAESPFSLLDIRRRITVVEYLQIIDAGILGHEPRVELLEGVIVDKEYQTISHAFVRDMLGEILYHVLPRGEGYFISMSSSVRIDNRDSLPEPDSVIFRGSIRDYTDRWRTSGDTPLIIEASDTWYDSDRSVKWSLYAASGVPVYWIVDIKRNRLEIHTEPSGQGENAYYGQSRIVGHDDEVPLVLDGREVARFPIREILP